MESHRVRAEGSAGHTGAEVAAEQSHHDVGAAGFPPVVVDRDDVRMLEVRDELRLGIEAADEVRGRRQVGRGSS